MTRQQQKLSQDIQKKSIALSKEYSNIVSELHTDIFELTNDWFDYDRKQRVIKLLKQKDIVDNEIGLLYNQPLDDKTSVELKELDIQEVRGIESERNIFESDYTSADAKRLDFLALEYVESHDILFDLMNHLIEDKWDNPKLREKIEKICDGIITINTDFTKLVE
jgi:hypothetical protein